MINYTETHGVTVLPQSALWIGPKDKKPLMTQVTNMEELQNALTDSIKEKTLSAAFTQRVPGNLKMNMFSIGFSGVPETELIGKPFNAVQQPPSSSQANSKAKRKGARTDTIPEMTKLIEALCKTLFLTRILRCEAV